MNANDRALIVCFQNLLLSLLVLTPQSTNKYRLLYPIIMFFSHQLQALLSFFLPLIHFRIISCCKLFSKMKSDWRQACCTCESMCTVHQHANFSSVTLCQFVRSISAKQLNTSIILERSVLVFCWKNFVFFRRGHYFRTQHFDYFVLDVVWW